MKPSVWLLSDTDHGCLSKGGWCSGWRQSRSNQTFHVMEVLQPTLIKCQPVICYLLNIWWSCYLHIMLKLPKKMLFRVNFLNFELQKKKSRCSCNFCKIPENGEGQNFCRAFQQALAIELLSLSLSFSKERRQNWNVNANMHNKLSPWKYLA